MALSMETRGLATKKEKEIAGARRAPLEARWPCLSSVLRVESGARRRRNRGAKGREIEILMDQRVKEKTEREKAKEGNRSRPIVRGPASRNIMRAGLSSSRAQASLAIVATARLPMR